MSLRPAARFSVSIACAAMCGSTIAMETTCTAVSVNAQLRSDIKQVVGDLDKYSPTANFDEWQAKNRQVLTGNHEPQSGGAVVLGVWSVDREEALNDASTFRLWSIEIPSLGLGKYRIDDSHVRAYFSTGGSSWTSNGEGYYSSDISGDIEVIAISVDEVTIKVDATTLGRYLLDSSRMRERFSISSTFRMPLRAFSQYLPSLTKCLRGSAS